MRGVVAVPEEGVIGSAGHRIAVFPGRVVGEAPEGHAVDLITFLVEYAENVESIRGMDIPLDGTRAQNRRFNCMDCAVSGQIIDTEKSRPPYVVVCK